MLVLSSLETCTLNTRRLPYSQRTLSTPSNGLNDVSSFMSWSISLLSTSFMKSYASALRFPGRAGLSKGFNGLSSLTSFAHHFIASFRTL